MIKEEAGSSVCLSESTCALVDLFEKAVAGGRDKHCENEVGTLRREIKI